MMKRILRTAGISLFLLLFLNSLFLAWMTFSYSIPMDSPAGERIRGHVGESLYVLQNDEKSPVFRNLKSYWADIGSDMIWMNCAVTTSGHGLSSAFHDAVALMLCTGETNPDDEIEDTYETLVYALYYPDAEFTRYQPYARYWMLIVGVIKLLFIFYSIEEIRYIFYYACLFLLILITCLLQKQFGAKGVIPFALACGLRVFLMHSISISTMPDIILTLLFMLSVLCFAGSVAYDRAEPFLFLAFGALSFAVGPLVAPLLTLAMPLIVSVLMRDRKDREPSSWIQLIHCSVQWAAGYVGSILIKQWLAQLVLHSSAENGSNQMLMYIAPERGLMERISMLGYCFMGLLDPWNVKVPILILAFLFLGYLFLRKGFSRYGGFFQLLFLACYPLFWILVVTRHSQHYFVANIMSIFVYGLFSALFFSVREAPPREPPAVSGQSA